MRILLNFSAEKTGLIIYEPGRRDGRIYNELSRVISGALQNAMLFKQIQDQAMVLERQKKQLGRNLYSLNRAMESFIETMILTIETRDPYTAAHRRKWPILPVLSQRKWNSMRILLQSIRMAGLVHDLGKIYVPSEILNKPGRLQEIEFNLIRIHPEIAYDILKSLDFAWPLAKIILQHHERYDGSGYPSGLKGDEILLEEEFSVWRMLSRQWPRIVRTVRHSKPEK